MTNQDNPLAAADNPQVQALEYFGQALMASWFCVIKKGSPKVDFDPSQHVIADRRTAVKLDVVPLPEMGNVRTLSKEYIAEFGDWPRITLKSIHECGESVLNLNGKFVKAALVPTGGTYTDKNTGEIRESLTIKILAVYPNEEACRAAYQAERGAPTNGNGHQAQAVAQTQVQAPPANGNGTNGNGNGNAERQTMLKFVKPLIQQAGGDPAALAAKIAQMPLLAKHFTVDSPEVVELLAEYQFAQVGK